MKRIFFTSFCSVVAFLAANAQTTDTTATSKSFYQIVTYLEHKLNTLVNENYVNRFGNSSTTSFTDFKISKDASGNIFLNLKGRIKSEVNNGGKIVYMVFTMSTSICNITDIKKVESNGKTYISILGETILTYVEAGRISHSNGLYFNLNMEASNTFETIKNAFLYLSTYCPSKKKDIN